MGNVSISSYWKIWIGKNVDKFHLNKVTKVSSKGFILEIDFEYH